MAIKIDASFIDDLFNIPRDGSNIADDDSDAYASVGEKTSTISFTEKAVEVAKEIQKTVANLPNKSKEIAPEKKEIVATIEKKEVVEDVIAKTDVSSSSMFEDILEDVQKTKAEEKVSQKVEEEKTTEKVVEVVKTPSKEPEDINKTVKYSSVKQLVIAGKPTKHKWTFEAPSPKYQKFYEAKYEALNDNLLKGGELPFDQYYEELSEANVDVTVGETFQAELVCQKMSECQRQRERIKQIQLRVNRQFFQWERHMDLFAGLLARLEDVKGVDKREGIKYEHMYDMESYFGELKSLHKSIDNVMRTLDSAFECLSRQVTITMPIKEVERYSNGSRQFTPAMGKFDGLRSQPNSGSSMTATKLKEAGTPAEPTQKSGWDI